MASYTGYFDESGHETTNFFTFGGLVLDTEQANAFDSEWKEAINPLGELHTSPFMFGKGEYEEWNSRGLEWKQTLLARAARVIAGNSFQTFSMTLDMNDFAKISEGQYFDRAVAHPYALGTRFAAVQIGAWSNDNSIIGRVPLVFEKREDRNIEETVRVFTRDHLDTPTFVEKGAAPLQATDLIAAIYSPKNARARTSSNTSLHTQSSTKCCIPTTISGASRCKVCGTVSET